MDVSFAYDALPKGSIRLIKVHNSDIFPPGDGIIDCSLQKFPLSESPPYTALSYVWGTDNPTRELRLNGKAILVRDNLHAFLCHIKPTPDDCLSVSDQKQYSPSYDEECRVRSMPTKDVPTAEVGYLWVDALCIDQGNNDEKMHQVAGMGRIYSRASRIVCWLGENCKDIITDLLLEYGVESDEKKPVHWRSNHSEYTPFFSHRYWRRAWIVQEASTANVPRQMWWGTKRLSWETVVLANRRLGLAWLSKVYLDFLLRPRPHAVERFDDLSTRRRNNSNSSSSSSASSFAGVLLDLLFKYSDMGATDHRDNVYALLPIAEDITSTISPLIPDYSIPVGQVYFHAARLILQDRTLSSRFDILLLRRLKPGGSADGLGGWVPDWANGRAGRLYTMTEVEYKAGGCWDLPFVHLVGEDGRLTLQCVEIDEINNTPPHFPFDDNTDAEDARIWKKFARFLLPNPEAKTYVNGEPLATAISRFLTWGTYDNDTPPIPLIDVAQGNRILSESEQESCIQYNTGVGQFLPTFRTKMGYWGTLEEEAHRLEDCDKVVVVLGVKAPLVLRRTSPNDDSEWKIVGPCYVEGVMNGEMLKGDYKTTGLVIR